MANLEGLVRDVALFQGVLPVIINDDFRNVLPDIIRDGDIIVTDPPFNIGYKYNSYSDNMAEYEYMDMLNTMYSICDRCVIVSYPEILHKMSMRFGKAPERVVAWVYNSNTGKQHRDIAYWNIKPDFSLIRQPYKNPNDRRIKARIANGAEGGRLYDWWDVNQVKNVSKKVNDHPCVMPLEVMRRMIGIIPDEGRIIDPFMGSGTTLLACRILGRECVGIEIDKHYCEIAEKRLGNGVR